MIFRPRRRYPCCSLRVDITRAIASRVSYQAPLTVLACRMRLADQRAISAISDHPVASIVWLMIFGVEASACGNVCIACRK